MELFKIRCTTCQTKLRVQDPAAVGEIVACPKCSSMVLIDPPPDWIPPRSISVPSSQSPVVAVTTDSSSGSHPAEPTVKAKPSPAPNASTQERKKTKPQVASSTPVPEKKAQPSETPSQDSDEDEHEEPPAEPIYLSPVERLGRQLTLVMIVPAVALLAFTVYWTVFSDASSSPSAPPAEPQDIAAGKVEEAPAGNPPVDQEEAEPQNATPPEFDVRWMPQDTTYAMRIGSSLLRPLETARVVIENQLPGLWDLLEPLLTDLEAAGVPVASVQWSGVVPGQWDQNSVIVLRLAESGEAVDTWFATGQEVEASVAGVKCREYETFRWPNPLALVDEQTLVTGVPEILVSLKPLAEANSLAPGLSELLSEQAPPSTSIANPYRFVFTTADSKDSAFNWLPTWVVVQSAAKDACDTLLRTPPSIDMRIGAESPPKLSIAVQCTDEAAVDSVEEACQQLVAALNERWLQEIKTVEQQQQSGRITTTEADQVRGVLSQALSTVQSAATLRNELTVVASFQLPGSVSDIASSFIDSEASRFRFHDLILTEGDLNHQQTIIQGLKTAAAADGQWPLGAAGAVQLRAETRLSWIASMLPYMEGGDEFEAMHQQLNFFRSWNDPANLEVTRRPLALFTNPRLGPSKTTAGFPTTNYVGVAGLGADAASLDPANPRAGVFNNRYRVPLEAIKDGGSQTIAVLGVTGRLGPWAAGGDATVRPLTIQPYFDGPDHFGSGMTGGMYAGMADGSVRFIADDIDPRVLEQLVTINSGPLDAQEVELSLKPATLPLNADQPGDLASPMQPEAEAEEPETATIDFDEAEVENNAAVVASLEARLPAIDFADVTLDDLVEFMAQLMAVKINFDDEAMSEAGVSPEDQLTVQLRDASYADVLDAALASLGLAFVIQQGELQITTLEKQSSVQRVAVYPIADLCGEVESCETLAAMVRSLVMPNEWSTVGGESRLLVNDNQQLIVQANERVHLRLENFLAKLRLARGIEPADEASSDIHSLVSRVSEAFEVLQTPVNVKLDEPTPLTDILDRLQRSTGVNLMLDSSALDAAGITPDVETSLQAAGLTLGQALDRLCSSLELTFRIVNSNTIQITTPTAAEGWLEIEFYPVGPQLAAGKTIDEIIITLENQVAPQSWRRTGGPATMHFDETSNYLIVLQTQRNQMQIEQSLSEGSNTDAEEPAP